MRLIEYLAVDGVFNFTASQAVPFVDTTPKGVLAATNGVKRTVTTNMSIFKKGDCFNLLSYGIMFPESFTFYQVVGETLARMAVVGRTVSGLFFPLPCFKISSLSSDVLVTMENREHVIEGFCDYNDFKDLNGKPVTEDYEIMVGFDKVLHVSMLNCPDDAVGQDYLIVPFVKISHNLPLI